MSSPAKTIFVPHLGGIEVGYRLSAANTFTYWDTALMSLQLLEALGIEQAFASGTSQGGWIAARMALLAPQRIQGIVLIGTSMDYESSRTRDLGCWDGVAACSGLITLHGDLTPAHDFEPGDAYYDFLMEIGFGKNVKKETRDYWATVIRDNYHGDEGKKRICMAAVNLTSRDGLHERLPGIRCPVLWLQGTADVVFSIKNAEEEIKLFKNSAQARLIPLEGGVDSRWAGSTLKRGLLRGQRLCLERFDVQSVWKSLSRSTPPEILPYPEARGEEWPWHVATVDTASRVYISQLEHRLKAIEERLKRLEVPQNEARPDTSHSIHFDTGSYPDNEAPAAEESSVASSIPFHSATGNTEIGEIDTTEDAIDGMGTIKFTGEEDCGYFGPSSNIAFIGHISFAMARGNASSPIVPSSNRTRVGTRLMSVSRSHHASEEFNGSDLERSHGGVNIYTLPSESRAWSLINKYFLKTGQLLPFIHEQSFCETYLQMKRDNFTMVRRTWLGLLNIIFAMATTVSIEGDISSETRIAESDMYYQRANSLCDKESRRNISVELVQYLLILGQYLQGTQKSVQAWTVHGLAITAAFQLGLHSPRANQDFSPLEYEIRKRVWFGCILLDRTLSMTFGRPAIIAETYVKMDLPDTLMQILGNTPQSEPSPQMDGQFYAATIVMYKIIDSCYGQNLGVQDSPTDMEAVSMVLAGERQLEEWEKQLSPLFGLRITKAPFNVQDLNKINLDSLIIERFNCVLSLRFHNLRVLLHRQFLEKLLDACSGNDSNTQSMETRILQQLGTNSVQTCVESAMVIISIVHTVVMSTGWYRGLLGAWNFSLFYTFNAGLVIFGALVVAPKDSNLTSQWGFVEQCRPYFGMAIEALQNLDRGNRVIERCAEYLSQLSSALMGPTCPSDMALSYGFLDNNHNASHGNSTNVLHQMQTPKQVPVESDLSEFMIDTDMDLVGKYFDVNRQYRDSHEIGGDQIRARK
ncbi:hypothetical protein B7463_g4515, partial [Scytalidium lignicola]